MRSNLSLRTLAALLLWALPLAASAQGDSAYRLKPNDQIRLNVFQHEDLLSEVQLTLAGEASFPLIGAIHLAGMTIKEAEVEIAALYDADYLVTPQVNINVLNAAADRVTVTGAVTKPGEVLIAPNTTLDLVNAIDWAGGLAPHADERRIELKRGETTKPYNLSTLRAKGAAQVVLQNGDRINVPSSAYAGKTVMVVGAITKTGPVDFPVQGKLDLDTAIGIAGGATEAADPSRITVKRAGKIFSAKLGGGHRLAPGDIVTIPISRFVGKTVTVIGQVGKPGQLPFPVDGKLDLLSAIARAGGPGRLANKRKVTVTRHTPAGNKSERFDFDDMAEGKIPLFYLLPGDTLSIPERRF